MNKYLITLGVFGLIVSDISLAKNINDPYAINLTPDSITISSSIGWLGGQSKEYVYNAYTGQKVSELIWRIHNTPIIKGDISWDPLFWLTLDARGWATLSSSQSAMDDYDWMYAHQSHWSHWSNSPNTHLNHANEFDINAKTWLIKRPDYRTGLVIGYQQTRFSWTAFGGHFQYDNGNYTGDFPGDQPGIGYQQKFSMPYMGLTGSYRYRDLEVNALLKFSPWVEARDNDEHYMRNLSFYEKTSGSRYYSASMDVGYYITPHTKLFTEFTWSKYTQGKGGAEVIDRESGESNYSGGNSAGLENRNVSLTAGLQYRF